ncbi:hypothetical protein [Pseudomonas fluorescens]|uniref:Morphogenetic protein n=1 Tax=Pseudomonas fluorescens TaxID=294 RepID=A0A4Y9TCF5_PSEFL|nr:hypothetical protein [Pseudomonas fluorescens]TFW42093.1 hypothetical protein E4T65_17005 [Pseudomonas fluorescens]
MPEIKERPILFSAPMVRAILEGRKTVTRREIKTRMRSADTSFELHQQPDGSWRPMHTFDESCMDNQGTEHPITCPYGQPGDRLWVRETWYCDHFEVQKGPYLQPADMHDLDQSRQDGELVYAADSLAPYEQEQPTWKPSIHMPRWASRILLEITDVRVERLQDITEDQARAEGVRLYTDHAELGNWWHVEGIETYSADPRKSFELLWSSVGGDWAANPWVWVVEFKRVTP